LILLNRFCLGLSNLGWVASMLNHSTLLDPPGFGLLVISERTAELDEENIWYILRPLPRNLVVNSDLKGKLVWAKDERVF
jgi:hypothetical protein